MSKFLLLLSLLLVVGCVSIAPETKSGKESAASSNSVDLKNAEDQRRFIRSLSGNSTLFASQSTSQTPTPAPSSPPCNCKPYVQSSPVSPSPTYKSGKKFERIVIFVLENTDYSTAMSNSYMANLTKYGASFTNFFACQHPSYPNYLNLVAAQDFGSTSDSSPSTIYGASTIVDVLEKKKISWKNYVDSNSPTNHNPLPHFYQISSNTTMMKNIVNSSNFFTDWKSRTLPAYSLYTSCCVEGQTAGGVPSLITFLNGIGGVAGINDYSGTLVQINYDESGTKSNCNVNQVYNLFLGDMVQPGCNVNDINTPYSILRTIEDNFGVGSIGNVGNFDGNVSSVTECWL